MPSGQAHTTWFPELKAILKNRWNFNLTIPEQFELVTVMNNKLNQIRTEGNITPPSDVVSEMSEATSIKIY